MSIAPGQCVTTEASFGTASRLLSASQQTLHALCSPLGQAGTLLADFGRPYHQCMRDGRAVASLEIRTASAVNLSKLEPAAVQETKDGEIVVFHDDTLARAVEGAGLNAAPAAALAEAGLDFRTATIQQLTYAQLRSFHLGGHPGVHIPSLRQFLRCPVPLPQHAPQDCV